MEEDELLEKQAKESKYMRERKRMTFTFAGNHFLVLCLVFFWSFGMVNLVTEANPLGNKLISPRF